LVLSKKKSDYSGLAVHVLVGVLLAGFIVWFAYFLSFGWRNNGFRLSGDFSDWTGFSQYYGGLLGPIVAFGALLMLYFAMVYQRQELEAAQKVFDFQRFENTFFHLLDSFRSAAQSVVYNREAIVENKSLAIHVEGKDVFVQYVQGVESLLVDKVVDVRNVYAGPFDEYGAYVDLSEYYGVLLQTVKYIDAYGQKAKSSLYVDILLSHMADFELRSLFFYGLSYTGKEMKTYIEKFSMLRYLASALLDDVPPYSDYVRLYDDSAYGLAFDTESFAAALAKIQKNKINRS